MTPNIYKLSSTPKEGIRSKEHKGFSSQVYREEDGRILGRGVMMLFQSIFGVPPTLWGWVGGSRIGIGRLLGLGRRKP